MAEKHFEETDPFDFAQVVLEGVDADKYYQDMARTFIEEYLLMGYTDEKILALFKDPFYQASHFILQTKGEDFVKTLIREVHHG
jgi:hypothetical protein